MNSFELSTFCILFGRGFNPFCTLQYPLLGTVLFHFFSVHFLWSLKLKSVSPLCMQLDFLWYEEINSSSPKWVLIWANFVVLVVKKKSTFVVKSYDSGCMLPYQATRYIATSLSPSSYFDNLLSHKYW